MKLVIDGTDIAVFSISLIREEGGIAEESIYRDTSPEFFLSHIHDFLKKKSILLDDVTYINCMTGPGSATAIRTTLSIVNTISFVSGIALEGGDPYLKPEYSHGPRITKSKKDALKRLKN